MRFLVTYDVETRTPLGRRRLRQVARICEGYGQRVQASVFEVDVSDANFSRLELKLRSAMDAVTDSIRIYPLHAKSFEAMVRLGRDNAMPDGRSWTL